MIGLPYYGYSRLSFSGLSVFLLFAGGVLFWTFFEYMMHRYFFHLTGEGKFMKRFLYVMHGNHHEFPRDRQRLFMPPLPSLLAATVLFFTFYVVLRNYTFIFFPGFVFGYLMYGSMHYAIHAWNPPFQWMKPLWRNHHLHHYKHEEKGFGVSSTLWDHVFGTQFDLKKEKEDKEKVEELMFKK
jgi:sterol desaturase/sphingolipid hydroxylase (fatty acid hydroxylase superfamily)